MTKFELPEKPKKTNTSEDFNNLRKAVDELDKFDYTWKTYANKADRRINAANKHIEELERENQRLVSENLALKTLVDNAKPQQALPVVPEFVDKFLKSKPIFNIVKYPIPIEIISWANKQTGYMDLEINITYLIKLKTNGYQVEKPQLFYLREELTGQFLAKDNQFKNEDRYFFWTGADPLTHSIGTAWKLTFTQQEIDSMNTGSYELVPVEDGE
ncbi:hypothetical protein KF282_1309 [Lactococcus lactis subsp. lactis]|uniref:DUF1642 domain-containing protein n=1 Tax=Lactococcus lactis subsp. lactis TaxID=1360 RepID=A0A0V8CXM5_LACLL|nr:DUF1642 domain-containing protein [Lactococcus lactis]KSU06059.1 hypothetical protein KF282_1309 [Lactococcus lactis subsp. lactis]